MHETLRIGKRLIPFEETVLVEPFTPPAEGFSQSTRDFKGRVVLLDKDGVLCEESPADFVRDHGFRLIAEDHVALNPAIRFAVEVFEPKEGFQPQKPFQTRLLWKGSNGATHSKLLLAPPEGVLTVVSGRETAVRIPSQPRQLKSRTRRTDPA